jgi:demethylmenaquinone methyltransferase/2-methoxy-6-polyprenyl-1,4-benzoquinol methylase
VARGLSPERWTIVVATLEKLFASSAYAPANRAMSFGLDVRLRRIIYSTVRGIVVDVGCGDGTHSMPFLQRAREVVCVDPLAHRLHLSSNNPYLHRVSGIAEFIPLRDKSTDFATAMFSFRDFLDKAKGLSEMRRVARIGIFILEIFNPSNVFRLLLYMYVQGVAPILGYIASRGSGRGWRLLMPTIRLMPRVSFFQKLGGKILVSIGRGTLCIVYLPSHKIQERSLSPNYLQQKIKVNKKCLPLPFEKEWFDHNVRWGDENRS